MTTSQPTARNWIFTIFPEDGAPNSESEWNSRPFSAEEGPLQFSPSLMKTLVYQMERCPSTGRTHLQGALALKQAARMRAVKQLLHCETAHLEICRDLPAAIRYSQKEESRVAGPWTLGQLQSAQGARSDITRATDLILKGAALREVAEHCPVVYAKLYKGLQALQAATKRPGQRERRCALLYGETGTGKTKMAYDLFGHDLYRVACIKNGWFDGYDGERYVLLDECGPGMFHWNKLKEITDRYPMKVAVKGGFLTWDPEVVILTSNCPLMLWYQDVKGMNPMDYRAIERRIKQFKFPDDKMKAERYLKGEPEPEELQATGLDHIINNPPPTSQEWLAAYHDLP